MTVIHREVIYSRLPGYRPLALDLYVPADPIALCLYLHGGGWRVGSRTLGPGSATSFFEQVAGMGLAVASADYRLSGEARFPAQLDDVRAALAFLDGRRGEFGVATPRTVAWGVSAGGHLAALAALAEPRVPLAAVVCWYTPTDLGTLADDIDAAGGIGDRSEKSREGALLGGDLRDLPDLVRAASPVSHAGPGAPPFLFLHGDADTGVPPRQSERLAGALRAAGTPAIVETIPGGTHMFPELDDTATMALAERSVRFLRASLT